MSDSLKGCQISFDEQNVELKKLQAGAGELDFVKKSLNDAQKRNVEM